MDSQRALAYWSVGQRPFRDLIVTFAVRYVPPLVDTLALQGSTAAREHTDP